MCWKLQLVPVSFVALNGATDRVVRIGTRRSLQLSETGGGAELQTPDPWRKV
jgi:hypothetical protein